MSERFEERVSAALAARAGEGADVAGMADGARSRLRSRRRTTATVLAAAVAVAAVPTVLALTGPSRDAAPGPGGPTTSAPDPTPGPDTDPAPDGQRVESWRNLTAVVPDAWRYGGGTDWCVADGGDQAPQVVRPEGAVRTIGCTPQHGHGLYFGDGSAIDWARESGDVWQYRWEDEDQVKVYPEDAWLGLFLAGDHYVMVVTPDEGTTREVLGSLRVVHGHDPNGCAVRDGEDAAEGDGDRLSFCRYGADGWLRESQLLSGADSVSFRQAVRAAPFKEGGESCEGVDGLEPAGHVRAGSGGDLGGVTVVFESWCPAENGIYLSGVSRDLTVDVMRWVLMPGWSGGLDGSVPVPQEPGSDQ